MFDVKRAMKEGCMTKDGRKVRLFCDDFSFDGYCIAGAVMQKSGKEHFECWEDSGEYSVTSNNLENYNLVNLPTYRYGYVYLQNGVPEVVIGFYTKGDRNAGLRAHAHGAELIKKFRYEP